MILIVTVSLSYAHICMNNIFKYCKRKNNCMQYYFCVRKTSDSNKKKYMSLILHMTIKK